MDLDNTGTLRRMRDDDATGGSTLFRPAVRPGTSAGSVASPSAKASFAGRLLGLDWWAKAAIAWSLFQFIALLISESLVMSSHLDEFSALSAINEANPSYLLLANQTTFTILPNSNAITIYMGLFVASQAFQVYLALDAIITSSKIQLVATTIFNFAVFGYSCLQFAQSANLVSADSIGPLHYGYLQSLNFQFHRTAPYEIVVIVLGAAFFVGWCLFAYKLYTLFGWSVFKELGADVDVRKRLTVYHIYMMLLKLDVFFFLSFVIQYVLLAFSDNSLAKTVTIIVSPIAVVSLLLVAFFAVTRESNALMTFLLVGLSAGIGYLVDRLIDIWTVTDTARYKSSKLSLTLFTTLTLICALATFAVAVLNFLNFGKGLMQSLHSRKTPVNTIDRSLELNSMAASGGARSYGTSSATATPNYSMRK